MKPLKSIVYESVCYFVNACDKNFDYKTLLAAESILQTQQIYNGFTEFQYHHLHNYLFILSYGFEHETKTDISNYALALQYE